MTTTRRPDERDARDSAGRRPRPKVERPADPPLPLKAGPRWPAFFAARITSAMKLFGRLAPRSPGRMRPGRGLKSSSRVVMTGSRLAEAMDGGRRVEIVSVSCSSASGPRGLDGQNLQSDQPLAPSRRRRFYLAVHGRRAPTGLGQPSNERQTSPQREDTRFRSLLTLPAGETHKQALRVRRERREIDSATDARRMNRPHSGARQFGVRGMR